jgi:hypothetical protein
MKAGLGLQPLSVSKGYGAYEAEAKLKEVVSSRKSQWADRYANAARRGDRREQNMIEKEIRSWNQKAKAEGKGYKIVDIRKMVKSRLDENNMKGIPKSMLGRSKEIAGQWR